MKAMPNTDRLSQTTNSPPTTTADLMTMTTSKPRSAFIGMTMDEAVALIHWHGERWQRAPERGVLKNPHGNGYGRNPLEITKATTRRRLDEETRDCAWCIAHQYGSIGLQELFKAVQKGTQEPYRYEIGRVMDLAFHGIAGWLV